jgi:hypothetical protein
MSVSNDAFFTNGHDSLYSISAQKVVLMVPTVAQKSTDLQTTKLHNHVGQHYSSGILVWR